MNLRTLTLESKMKFGKYADYKVKDLFASGKIAYLIWVYFNMSKITFIDDILDMIISTDMRIQKPGIDAVKGQYYSNRVSHEKWLEIKKIIESGDWSSWRKMKQNEKYEKQEVGISMMQIDRSKTKGYSSRARLQAKNHGHI